MSPLARRWLPASLVLLCAVACSKQPGGAAASAPAATPSRQTAAQPAYVDTVDARSVARSLVLCRTTADTLRRQLGEPTRDGMVHGLHVMSWSTRSQTPQVFLAILVDARGVVADIYWDVPAEIPWVPTDQCARR